VERTQAYFSIHRRKFPASFPKTLLMALILVGNANAVVPSSSAVMIVMTM